MSTLKTAWLNLQDGLGKRFAWSHVKAIFYNYAEKKLLSTKLDEMDTAINSKVNKADIVQTESTATDKVPSAAYLKEIKDGLDNDIGELTSRQIMYSPISSLIIGLNEPETIYFQLNTTDGRKFTITFSNTKLSYGYNDEGGGWHSIWEK